MSDINQEDLVHRLRRFHASMCAVGGRMEAFGEAADRIEELEAENRKLRAMIDNGLGWEDMQQDSMQSHLGG